jgi:dethiobiotin synthetase
MALRGFFITGTGTGVGKTAVAAALLFLLNNKGIRSAPVKPVQTGVSPGEKDDLDLCLKTAGLNPAPEELKLMCPYRFSLPGSPHLAAEEEGVVIDLSNIVRACQVLSSSYMALVVEGAGGILVPLTRRLTTLDLIRELDLPLIITARAGLGTINHTLLTLETASRADVKTTAVVLNHPEPVNKVPVLNKIETDNRKIIQELGWVPVWEALPHIPGAGERPEPTRELAGHLACAGAEELIKKFFQDA